METMYVEYTSDLTYQGVCDACNTRGPMRERERDARRDMHEHDCRIIEVYRRWPSCTTEDNTEWWFKVLKSDDNLYYRILDDIARAWSSVTERTKTT